MSEKTVNNTNIVEAKKNVGDIKIFGKPDQWELLCKASSEKEGWMKSTKAMSVGTGCIVQCTTQQRNPNGSYTISESVCFVPGVRIVENIRGGGRRLQP